MGRWLDGPGKGQEQTALAASEARRFSAGANCGFRNDRVAAGILARLRNLHKIRGPLQAPAAFTQLQELCRQLLSHDAPKGAGTTVTEAVTAAG